MYNNNEAINGEINMLTAKQISVNYQIKVRKVYKIAKEMKISKGKDGQYHFPDDFRPIYIPDGRSYKSLKQTNHKPYVYIMDVIVKMWLAKDYYLGIDEQIRQTVVKKLKSARLIELKEGALETSLDYRDYIVSFSDDDWFNNSAKERENFIINALEVVSKGVSNGAIEAVIESSKRM